MRELFLSEYIVGWYDFTGHSSNGSTTFESFWLMKRAKRRGKGGNDGRGPC